MWWIVVGLSCAKGNCSSRLDHGSQEPLVDDKEDSAPWTRSGTGWVWEKWSKLIDPKRLKLDRTGVDKRWRKSNTEHQIMR
jgi:hypothetical protein